MPQSETVCLEPVRIIGSAVLFFSNYCKWKKKKKNKWEMFHDIRALLLMIFLETRVRV